MILIWLRQLLNKRGKIVKSRKVVNYLIAAGLPVFIMLVVFASLHIYPFGPKSILSGDLLGQYISIMNYVGGQDTAAKRFTI